MNKEKILIAAVMSVMLFAGCIKTDLDNCLVEPDSGNITITTDWSNRGPGVDIPSIYTIELGSYSAEVSGMTHTFANSFDTGIYRLYVYNDPDNITISGNRATVTTVTAPEGNPGLFISPVPGWFFSYASEVGIESNRDHNFTAVMVQHIGELTLVLEPTGGSADVISSITGSLSGIASTLNMDSGQMGDAANIPLVFTRDPVDGRWKVTVRILGITGPVQTLTALMQFSDGTPAQSMESNMSEALAGFNNNKTNFPPLEGEIVETPTGSGFTAAINGWRPGNGSGGNETAN